MTEPIRRAAASRARRRVIAGGRRSADVGCGRAARGYTGWRACAAIRRPRPARPAVAKPRAGIAPLARGEVAAVTVAQTPCKRARPRLQGRARARAQALADWRGRTVLLNLWATWCVPCRKEMPALDALAGQARRRRISRWSPINIDTRDLDKPQAWLKEVGVNAARLLRRPEREGVSGPQGDRQGLRHADDAADRPPPAARLGDAGGPGRMGERRRREARQRGDADRQRRRSD